MAARERLPREDIRTAASSPTLDFDAGRDLLVRFAFALPDVSIGVDAAGVIAEIASIVDFGPKFRAFATVERCSE